MKIRIFQKILPVLSVFVLVMGSASASAETMKMKGSSTGVAPVQSVPASVETMTHSWGFKVLKSFPTQAPGIQGYVVKNKQGKMGVLYGYKGFVIAGGLYNPKGHDLTKDYNKTELPEPDFKSVADKLQKDPLLITEGSGKAPQVYVFADPNCIFCHKFWEETRDWVKQGKIQIHWVMVGFLKPSSAGRAARIMSMHKRSTAVDLDEAKFNVSQEEGAVKTLEPIPANIQTDLDEHSSMMKQLGFSGTPAVVFRGLDGKWTGSAGLPPRQLFARLLGISEKG